jgi:hypothetical protein
MGVDAFRDDVLASAGLDDRTSSVGYLQQAEELMADAVRPWIQRTRRSADRNGQLNPGGSMTQGAVNPGMPELPVVHLAHLVETGTWFVIGGVVGGVALALLIWRRG